MEKTVWERPLLRRHLFYRLAASKNIYVRLSPLVYADPEPPAWRRFHSVAEVNARQSRVSVASALPLVII